MFKDYNIDVFLKIHKPFHRNNDHELTPVGPQNLRDLGDTKIQREDHSKCNAMFKIITRHNT